MSSENITSGELVDTVISVAAHIEAELEESRQFLASMISNVGGAIYRCTADDAWTMQFISDEIEAISGYPASDFIDNAVANGVAANGGNIELWDFSGPSGSGTGPPAASTGRAPTPRTTTRPNDERRGAGAAQHR